MKDKKLNKLNKKIEGLELNLRIIIGEIAILDKLTEAKDKDGRFYLKLSDLFENARKIFFGNENGKNEATKEGLLNLLIEKSGLSWEEFLAVNKEKK